MEKPLDPADRWITTPDGSRVWGAFGASGILAYDRLQNAILLQHRTPQSHHGDTWGIPGGAKHEHESAIAGALRETGEETGMPADAVAARLTHVHDKGNWSYTTVLAEVVFPFTPVINDHESLALAWVPLPDVAKLPLHPGVAACLPVLTPLLLRPPTVIVDVANVVGSVPDGWWRDRVGAAARLQARIEALAATDTGIPCGFTGLQAGSVPGVDRALPRWVLVTEGQARTLDGSAHTDVVAAKGLGDDTIVEQVRLLAGPATVVVTSDRALRVRCRAAGATTTRGAGKLLRLLEGVEKTSGSV